MNAYELAHRLVCQCSTPIPVRVGAWEARECRACWRPIIPQQQAIELMSRATELIGLALEHGGDA